MNLYSQAFQYAVRGYSILPIGRDKHPLVSSWKQYQKTAADEQEIESWWKKNPNANIGIVTGKISGITVIDVDMDGTNHVPIEMFPETLTIKTPSGGYHLFYKYAEGFTVSANAYPQFPHVDIRSDGGFVVAAPSICEYTKNKKRIKGSYAVIKNLPLAEFPVSLFSNGSAKETKKTPLKTLKEIQKMRDGDGRNSTITSMIGKLLLLSPADKWDDDVWTTILGFNATMEHPLPLKELQVCYTSIKSKEMKRRRDSGDMGLTPKEQSDLVVTFDSIILDHKPMWKLRIAGETQDIYEYHNGVYVRCTRAEIENIIANEMLKAGLKDMRKRTRIQDIFGNVRSRLGTESGKSFLSIDEIKNGHVINMKNGLYNINTKKFSKHTPEFISTVQIPIEYDAKATAPRWMQFIDEVSKDRNDIAMLLQQIMGYCLTRRVDQQKAFILHGEGRNGKSRFTAILGLLVGHENMRALSLTALQSDVMIDSLDGKTLNITEEKSENYIESDRLKSLITGEMQTGNPKHRDPKTFQPFCKFIFAFNGLPRFNDNSRGLYRRFIFVPFDAKFEGVNDDKHLSEKLIAELPGIFNWAIEGLASLEADGHFHETADTQASMEDFKIDGSSVSQFISECFVPGDVSDTEISIKTLYKEYQNYCNDSGLKPKSKIVFSRDVAQFPLQGWNIVCERKSVRVGEAVTTQTTYKNLRPVDENFFINQF